MRVEGHSYVTEDADASSLHGAASVAGVRDLVFEADVMGPKTGVEKIILRQEQLEDHGPDGDEAGLEFRQIKDELCPVEVPEVVNVVKPLDHGVDVVPV